MKSIFALAVAVSLFGYIRAANAADLAQIERKIAKEPAYHGQPKYCLLVFGPEARTRIWIVMDDESLYVDRNGNGDLTEKGKKVAPRDLKFPRDKIMVFDGGELQDRTYTHKLINVQRYIRNSQQPATGSPPKIPMPGEASTTYSYFLGLDVEIPSIVGRQGTSRKIVQWAGGWDVNGYLQFSDKPENAPILHFVGHWQMMPQTLPGLAAGSEAIPRFGIGTPGLGAGAVVWTNYFDLVPSEAQPKIEITFPARNNMQAPEKELFELKERC